jgi:tetratricopeptide (TPR) repeat protein
MNLTAHLSTLESSGLILLARVQPELEYLFRHALIHDAAYSSLVRRDRRQLHRAAGEALEALAGAAPDSPEWAPALAHHFDEAGDQPRALRYHTLAGRAAARAYANMEAHEHFSRAIELAAALNDRTALVDLYLRRGRVLELSAQDDRALANYAELEAWAVSHADPAARLAALNARATIYVKPSVQQSQALGYEVTQQALALARDLGDRPAEAHALWNLLQYYQVAGNYADGLAVGERALALARDLDDREQVAFVLTDLSKLYFMVGRLSQSWEVLSEAHDHWQALGLLNMLADNLASSAFMNILIGHYDEALSRSEQAARVSHAIGNVWNQAYSLYSLDLLHFERGDPGQALAVSEECRRLSGAGGFAEGVAQSTFDRALILSYVNDLPGAFAAARQAATLVGAQPDDPQASPRAAAQLAYLFLLQGNLAAARALLAPVLRRFDLDALKQQFILEFVMVTMAEAHLTLAEGDHARALIVTEAMVNHYRAVDVHLFFVDALYLQGLALRANGRAADAEAALRAALDEAHAIGSRRAEWQILAALAGLTAARGDPSAALTLYGQAAALIHYIADHAGSADHTAAFLRRADVQAALHHARASA